MNFAIKHHTKRKRRRLKNKTKAVDLESLRTFAITREKGAEFDAHPGDRTHLDLQALKGHVRCAGKRLFVAHHPDRINVLHCGDAPSLA